MSMTFAQLGIEFTTRTAAKAANDIDKVEKAAGRAEKRAEALSGKSKRLATDMATGAKGVRRVTNALGKMHGGARRATDGIELVIARINKLKGVATAVVAAAGALSFLGVSAINTGTEIDRMARISNALPSEFQRWAAGAKSVGIEQEQLADILKDVNDRIGDYVATGGGEMADFFDNIAPKVGVTAKMFRELSGPQALQLYVDSLKKAGASQQDLTFYLEAMANDATALIPLLANGGAEMQRLGDRAVELGGILSDDAVRGLAGMKQSLNALTTVTRGVARELGSAMAPAVAAVADVLTALMTKGSALRLVLDGLAAIISGTANFLTGLITIVSSATSWLWDMAKAGAKAVDEFTGLSDILKTVIENSPVGWIYDAVTGFADLIRVTGGFGSAMSLLGDVVAGVWEGISGSAKAIVPALGAVWEDVKSGFFQLMESLTAKWRDFLTLISGWAASIPGAGELSGSLMQKAGAADAEVTNFMRAANDAEEAANGLRETAKDLATGGFDKARDALSKLNVTVGETTSRLGTGASGGGLSPAAGRAGKAADALRKEVDKLNKAAATGRTPLEKYRAELAKLEALKKLGLTDGAYAMELERINAELADGIPIIGDVADAWGEFVAGGLRNFNDFVDRVLGSFKSMIAEMIATAARNQIILNMDLNPMGSVGGAVSAAGSSAGGGTGLLGSILGGGGGFVSGIGGGFGIGMANLFGAGGGVGTYFTGLGAQAGAIFAEGFSASALGGLVGMAGPLMAVGAILMKGLSRTYEFSGIRGNFTSGGFEGKGYDFYKGGFLRGDKTDYYDISGELQMVLDDATQSVVRGIEDMSDAVGLSTKKLEGFVSSYVQVNTNQDPEAVLEDLMAALEDAGDEMAQMVLGTTEFTRAGESALEALTRLGTSITAVNDAADLLGHRVWDISLASADAASELVDLFGGIDNMTAAVNTYWRAFYSEAERTDTTIRMLRDTFAQLGVVMPESRDQYRQLVEGIDTTNDRGRELYAALISLSGAMDEILPAVAQFTMSISGVLSGVDASVADLIDTAKANKQTTEQAAALWYRTATTLRQFLTDLLDTELTAASPSQQLAANQSRYQAAFEAARGGDVDAARQIPALARAYLDSARATASSGLDYRRIAAQVQGQVNFLGGIAELEGANQDVLATLYEEQIEVLTALSDYLQLTGLDKEDFEKLDGSIQDWVKGLDKADFETVLADLADAITDAQDFSYDKLLADLDITLSLADKSNLPNWMKDIIDAAGGDIKTTLDFIIRRNDLTPDMRWLAVNSVSEHIKTIKFITGSKVDEETAALALATGGELRRNLKFFVTKELSREQKLIALSGNREISRTINAVLSSKIDPLAKKLALGNLGAYAVAISAAFAPNINKKVRQVVIDQQASYAAIINAAISQKMGDGARRILLKQQGTYIANITAILASNMTNPVRSLLLNANTQAVRAVTVAMAFRDTVSKEARGLLLNRAGEINRTILAAVRTAGISPTGAVFLTQLGLGDAAYQKSLIGKIALGALSKDEKRLLRAADAYVKTTLTLGFDLSATDRGNRTWRERLLAARDQSFITTVWANFDLRNVSNPRRRKLLDARALGFKSEVAAEFNLSNLHRLTGTAYRRRANLLDATNKVFGSTLVAGFNLGSLTKGNATRRQRLLDAKGLSFVSQLIGGFNIDAFTGDGIRAKRLRRLLDANQLTTSGVLKAGFDPNSLRGDTLYSKRFRRLLDAEGLSLKSTLFGAQNLKGLDRNGKLLLNAETNAITKTLNGIIELDRLTHAQKSLLTAINGATTGKITLAGGFTYSPSEAFKRLYEGTSSALLDIKRPMETLGEQLDLLRAEVAKQVAMQDKQERVTALDNYVSKLSKDAKGNTLVGDKILSRMAKIAGIDISGMTSRGAANALARFSDTDLFSDYAMDQTGIKRLRSARRDALDELKSVVAQVVSFDAATGGYLNRAGVATSPIVSGGRLKWTAGLPDSVMGANADDLKQWRAIWWAKGGLEDRLWAADRSVATIDRQIASFDGGGYTGDWARSGGMDGKGGRLGLLHPRETVSTDSQNKALLAEIKALREEVAGMRDEEAAANRVKARHLETIADHSERVDQIVDTTTGILTRTT
ncbi:hypothetical protein [Pseudodonghicola flavimaris]|uniref:Uncharacterized protein n=1 Tax=Pseudodonghicola flavimaris TaxID=3050036 RepID=A0ABT7F828_9RHOB|nr:hypothetical protein [Pseudodonghicola flavimaris]MDK3020762.1 hypothetical protein [Pseudodonghicola flavimaris]